MTADPRELAQRIFEIVDNEWWKTGVVAKIEAILAAEMPRWVPQQSEALFFAEWSRAWFERTKRTPYDLYVPDMLADFYREFAPPREEAE